MNADKNIKSGDTYDDFHYSTQMKKLRGAKTIRGKDIDHKNGNPRDNRIKNLRVRSIKLNRGKK